MTRLPNVSEMSVVEYVDFLESTALYTGVSVFELNMENRFEIGVIGDEMYERAKWELNARVACDSLERDWPERG
jgi:hypothetical protein